MYNYQIRRQKKVDPINAVSATGTKHHERRKEMASKITLQSTRSGKTEYKTPAQSHSTKATPISSNADVIYDKMHDLLDSRYASQMQLHRKSTAPLLSAASDLLGQRNSVVADTSVAHLHPSLRRGVKKKKKKNPEQEADGGKKPPAAKNVRKEEEQYMHELSLAHQREYLSRSTHFTYEEISNLQSQFMKIAEISGTPGEMKRLLFTQMFVDVFGITDNIMLDNIFRYFDADGEGSVSCTEWIQNLSIILRGTLEEQVQYVYKIYDLNGDGGIGREEIRIIIQDSMTNKHHNEELDDPHENLNEIVEMIMRRLEEPGTGQITLPSFYHAVRKDPLDLQCLGQCIPDPRKAKAFLCLLTADPYSFNQNYSLPHKATYPDEHAKYVHAEHMVSAHDSIMQHSKRHQQRRSGGGGGGEHKVKIKTSGGPNVGRRSSSYHY